MEDHPSHISFRGQNNFSAVVAMRKILFAGIDPSKTTMNGGSSSRETLNLDPPSFQLPEDDDRYELWTVRLPASVACEDLEGTTISLDPKATETQFESKTKTYNIQWGHSVENESFRLLTPQEPDSSDDEVDGNQQYLFPSSKFFSRHLNVVTDMPKSTETELAPRLDNAPPAVDPVRRAYEPVPPKVGLKRRWFPVGACKATEERKPVAKRRLEQEVVLETKRLKSNGEKRVENVDCSNGDREDAQDAREVQEEGKQPAVKEQVEHTIELEKSRTKLDETKVVDNGNSAGKRDRKAEKKARKEAKKAKKHKKESKKHKKKDR